MANLLEAFNRWIAAAARHRRGGNPPPTRPSKEIAMQARRLADHEAGLP